MPRHTGVGVNDKKVGSLERGSLRKERVKGVNKGDRLGGAGDIQQDNITFRGEDKKGESRDMLERLSK